MKWHSLRGILQVAIGVAIAAIVMQTWLVLGWIVPMTVSGSSMAPALLGPHRWFRCEECAHDFAVGLDQLPLGDVAVCPRCGERRAVAKTLPDERGQRLAVDRTAFAWREPRRWETVVFQCPENAVELCVKRIVGLPGEAVTLDDGDVLVNGEIARKSLAEQRAVRQLVDDSDDVAEIRRTTIGDVMCHTSARWFAHNASSIAYRFPGDGLISDECGYNQGQTPPVNRVTDVMLTFSARLDGNGKLTVAIVGYAGRCQIVADLSQRVIVLSLGAKRNVQVPLPAGVTGNARFKEWTVSTFDRMVLVAIGDEVVVAEPWTLWRHPGIASNSPAAIRVSGLRGEIRQVSIWRDVYYALRHSDGRQPGVARGTGVTWRLGTGEYFVLGDNAAISDDSRSWPSGPGIDAKLFIGKPLGVR